MGTGRSPANRAAYTATSLDISANETIDLSDFPLIYGKDDGN